jgi:hypothetical protein
VMLVKELLHPSAEHSTRLRKERHGFHRFSIWHALRT